MKQKIGRPEVESRDPSLSLDGEQHTPNDAGPTSHWLDQTSSSDSLRYSVARLTPKISAARSFSPLA